jgi:hypothetical protein
LGAGDVDVEGLKSGPDATDDFGWPEGFAEESDPAAARLADTAKGVAGIGGLVGVQAAMEEFAFESGICVLRGGANAKAERFRFETGEELAENFDRGLGNHKAAGGGSAVSDVERIAEIADPVQVAEEIEDEGFRCGKGKEGSGPDFGGLRAAERLAAFSLDELEAEGFDASAKFQGLDSEGKGREIENRIFGVHG